MNRTRVVLADDHAVLRDGLRTVINACPDLLVVAEAGSGREAVEKVREAAPRVLCLDLSMPGGGGVAAIEKVKAAAPGVRVLVFTMHDDPAYLRAALSAGADGYVLKSSPVPVLLDALRAVAAGNRAVDPALRAYVDDSAAGRPADGPSALSRREREVLELLVRGHTHQEIADRLFVSVKTVETYRARVRDKTGLKTRADFVRYGLEAGLLGHPPEGA